MKVRKLPRMIVLLVAAFMALFSIISLTTFPALAESAAEITTEYAIPSDSVVLAKGATGEDVKWLQSALNTAMNANLTVDGNFGGNTETALIEFQKSKGIDANGKADSATINALAEATGQRITTVTTQTTDNADSEAEEQVEVYWDEVTKAIKKIIFHFGEEIKYVLYSLLFIIFIAAGIIFVVVGAVEVPLSIFLGVAIGLNKIGKAAIWISIILTFLFPIGLDMYYNYDNYSLGGSALLGKCLIYALLRILIALLMSIAVLLAIYIVVCIIGGLIHLVSRRKADTGDTFFEICKDIAVSTPFKYTVFVIAGINLIFLHFLPIYMFFTRYG